MKVGLCLGSNQGERYANIQQARDYLLTLSTGSYIISSSLYETLPIDCPPNSPMFLNCAIEIDYDDDPKSLLAQIKTFESYQGRDPHLPINSARVIDIDILYFGNEEVTETDLIIPHPRLSNRRFVLAPLSEVCPDRKIAGQGKTVKQLLDHLPVDNGEVKVIQNDW